MFGISPGDSLLLLADTERGIALNTIDYFNRVADAAFERPVPDKQDVYFAGAVKAVTQEKTKE